MAGDWIKMRLDLQSHPKVVRILSATKSDKFRVVGGLHAVWSIFDTHSEDGILSGYTPEAMDQVIGWLGFSDALISVGWLNEIPEGLVMPEFQEHNGKSGKRRAEDQKRKRVSRKSATCPQSVRNSSADEPDKKLTREEKRREEVKTSSSETDSAEEEQKKITYQNIADLYNRVLGETLGKVLALSDQRKKHLAARVKESSKRQSLDWWESYFVLVSETPFLCGHGPPRENGKPWKADFDWLINQNNMVKAIEGTKYQ